MGQFHLNLVRDAFSKMPDESTDIRIITIDGSTMVKRQLLCFFSNFINNIFKTIPDCLDTVLILPEFSLSNVLHIVEIVGTGKSSISSEERKTYYDIIEEAQIIGIEFEDVSISKNVPKFTDEDLREDSANKMIKLKIDSEKIKLENVDLKRLDSEKHESNDSEEFVFNKDYIVDTDMETEYKIFKTVNEKEYKEVGLEIVENDGPVQASKELFSEVNEESQLNAYIKVLQSGNFKCICCTFQSSYKANVQTHVSIQHVKGKEEKFSCFKCSRILSCKSSLDLHIRSIHENIRSRCEYCDKTFATMHMKKIHVQSKHLGIMFQCDECSYKASRKHHLKDHIIKIHSICNNRELFQCGDCENEYATKKGLNQHILSLHKFIRYPCPQCSYKATKRSLLKLHVKTIHDQIRIPCPLCESTHATKSNLKKHIAITHEGIRQQCPDCPFQCRTMSTLNNHTVKVHN